jgi:hypothetical protein
LLDTDNVFVHRRVAGARLREYEARCPVGFIALKFLSRAVHLAVACCALASASLPAGAQQASALGDAAAPVRLEPTLTNWWGSLPAGDPRIARDNMHTSLSWWLGSVAEDGILRDIAVQPWNYDWGGDTFYGFSYSRRFLRFWTDFTLDFELGGAFRAGQTNSPEAWYALYVRYDGFPWRNRLYTSFGLSTGLDWLNTLPEVETGTAARPEPNQSKILHYFSPEIVFSLPDSPQHELAIRYIHRSGVFGSFNGVWEGSNVLAVAYRRRF